MEQAHRLTVSSSCYATVVGRVLDLGMTRLLDRKWMCLADRTFGDCDSVGNRREVAIILPLIIFAKSWWVK